ncbi:hypothetical protein [Ekhidna sp.]|uniref:hypothetical protein n=1 Tax=Ekhidna sp. TaxID=2608089 RepID=UPI003CCC2E5A
MRLSFCMILMSFLFLMGCESDSLEGDRLLIRIHNSSGQIFESVYVSSGDSDNTYLNITPGKFSNYQPYEIAYRYGYVKVISSDKEYVIQPFDYVGETPLGNGRYTYALSIESENLSLQFIED